MTLPYSPASCRPNEKYFEEGKPFTKAAYKGATELWFDKDASFQDKVLLIVIVELFWLRIVVDLHSLDGVLNPQEPSRTIELHLIGNMVCYMWSFDVVDGVDLKVHIWISVYSGSLQNCEYFFLCSVCYLIRGNVNRPVGSCGSAMWTVAWTIVHG